MRTIGSKADIHIKNDSWYVRDNLAKNLKRNEDLVRYVQCALLPARNSRAKEEGAGRSENKILSGLKDTQGNEGAGSKADGGTQTRAQTVLSTLVECYGINPRGIKLQNLARRLAY
jgi:hypothetical protein